MITPMKKITVFALQNRRKVIMESLQKMGCVELEKISDGENLLAMNVKEQTQSFERYMASAKSAIEILDEISPEKKGMFAEKETVLMENYSLEKDRISEINKVISEVILKNKKINETASEIAQTNARILSLKPWVGLDVNMNFNSLKNAEIALYTINGAVCVEELDKLFEETDGVYYEIVSTKSDFSCVWFTFLKEISQKVHKIIRENGFISPSSGLSETTPEKNIMYLEKRIKELSDESEALKADLKKLCEKRSDIKLLHDYFQIRCEKYENLEKIGQTKKAFVLSGFLPAKNADEVKERIEKTGDVFVIVSEIADDEEAPVLFSNNGFAKPVEEITATYSMPSKNDIDPNPIMAFFYYLFFGMMFSDAGYGILLMLGTGYLGFVKKYKPNFMKMFFFCGISTTFWGFMYGSFFGDLIYRFSLTFLGKEIVLAPVWVDPAKEPLLLLVFSIMLGIIQILVGLMISFYMSWRIGKKADAVFDIGSWILIMLGILLLAGGIALGVSPVTTAGTVLAVIGAVMIVLMKARDNKNIIMRLLSGILGLYDITSYVSDALSYSRLMALGLATGVIAQVVNIMGTLAGNSVLGFIMFVAVFIIGNLLNFAINMLGAYVHTNRLQYVEFYSKFYEGGGKAFEPMAMNTEYYEFKEK